MTFKETDTEADDEVARETPTSPVNITEINTLHELLALAIGDFRKVLADDRYAIDMGVWHSPGEDGDDTCHVCLAGSVLAKTVQLPLDVNAEVSVKSAAIWDRLFALNDLRCGAVCGAIKSLHGRGPDIIAKHIDAYEFVEREGIGHFPREIANPDDRKGGYALLERLEDMQRKLKAAGL